MPAFTMVPPRGDHPVHGHFWVPIDDENCWVFTFDYLPARALTATELQAMKDGHGVHNEYVPGTYRPLANKDNDYLMDRAAQRRGETFSGIKGIAIQDASLQESMGPIVDRTKERLVSADSGIIKARRKLLSARWRCARRARRRRASTRPTTGSGRPRSCCPRSGRSWTSCPRRGHRDPRRPADVGLRLTMANRPLLANSCAMAATAAEARFRIDAKPQTPRATQRRRPRRRGDGAGPGAGRPGRGTPRGSYGLPDGSPAGEHWRTSQLRTVHGESVRLCEELAEADFVMMIATEGRGAAAATAIGDACTLRGIMTAGVILGRDGESAAALTAPAPQRSRPAGHRRHGDASELLAAVGRVSEERAQ